MLLLPWLIFVDGSLARVFRQVLLILLLLLVHKVPGHLLLLHILLAVFFVTGVGITLVAHGALRSKITAKRLLLLLI